MTASYYKFRQKAVSNMLTDTFSVCEEAHLYYLDYKSFKYSAKLSEAKSSSLCFGPP